MAGCTALTCTLESKFQNGKEMSLLPGQPGLRRLGHLISDFFVKLYRPLVYATPFYFFFFFSFLSFIIIILLSIPIA